MGLGYACSLEEASLPAIRAHTQNIEGVPHPSGFMKGERYCQHCHGDNLAGGPLGEPSCYRCHGVNWQQTGADTSSAPTDHTQVQLKFNHHPSLQSPVGTCDTAGCHGAGLSGDAAEGTPSCYLCHDAVWAGG